MIKNDPGRSRSYQPTHQYLTNRALSEAIIRGSRRGDPQEASSPPINQKVTLQFCKTDFHAGKTFTFDGNDYQEKKGSFSFKDTTFTKDFSTERELLEYLQQVEHKPNFIMTMGLQREQQATLGNHRSKKYIEDNITVLVIDADHATPEQMQGIKAKLKADFPGATIIEHLSSKFFIGKDRAHFLIPFNTPYPHPEKVKAYLTYLNSEFIPTNPENPVIDETLAQPTRLLAIVQPKFAGCKPPVEIDTTFSLFQSGYFLNHNAFDAVVKLLPDEFKIKAKKRGSKKDFQTKTIEVNDENKKKIIDQLKILDCVSRIGEKSFNLKHPKEKTPGGWFVYWADPGVVRHHAHKSMKIIDWIKKYYADSPKLQAFIENPPDFSLKPKKKIVEFPPEKIKTIVPYYETPNRPPRLDPEDGHKQINDAVIDWIEGNEDMAIKSDAGSGKSEAAWKEVLYPDRFYRGVHTLHYLVGTHALGEDLKQTILTTPGYKDLDVIVVKGRTQFRQDKPEEHFCTYAGVETKNGRNLLDAMSSRGLSITQHLCKMDFDDGTDLRCDHWNECNYKGGYWSQFKNDYDVVILTHDALINYRSEGTFADPDMVIIDESFWNKFHAKATFTLDQLMQYKNEFFPNKKGEFSPVDDFGIITTVIKAIDERQLILKTLREKLKERDIREAVKIAGKWQRNASNIVPGMNGSAALQALDDTPYKPPIHRFFKAIKEEWNSPHDDFIKILYNTNGFQIFYLKELQQYEKVKKLILDADYEPYFVNQIFGKEIPFKEIRFKHQGYSIQVKSSTSAKSKFLDKDGECSTKEKQHCIDQVNQLAQRFSFFGSGLIVTYKRIEDLGLIQLPDGWDIEHFGNFRGINTHNDKKFVIIAGRNEPKVKEVEDHARCFLSPTEVPLQTMAELTTTPEEAHKFSDEKRGYTMRDGSQSAPIKTSYHPDKRVDRVLKQIRECETVQAAARIRDVYQSDKIIINLSSVPVDMEIDLAIGWRELMDFNVYEQLLQEDGIVSFNAKYLCKRCPEKFFTENAAKQYKFKRLKGYCFLLVIINRKETPFRTLDFKGLDKKNWSECITCFQGDETQGWLENILNYEIELKEDRLEQAKKTPASSPLENEQILPLPLPEKCLCGGEINPFDQFCHSCFEWYGEEGAVQNVENVGVQ